jgi:hypothetical protein
MIADLFLRTYPADYKWLPFLFRSLLKHARCWRDLIITLPRPSDAIIGASGGSEVSWLGQLAALDTALGVPFKTWAERFREKGVITGKIHVFQCDTHYPDDYLGQCITKLRAWEYTDADEVAFLDSDNVLLREWNPCTLRGFETKPLIEVRDWNDSGQAKVAWFDITEHLLGDVPPYETMCRHPFQYPVQFLRRAYALAATKLVGVMKAGRKISEFNYLGNYAVLHEPDSFVFRAPQSQGPDVVKQFWSYGGLNFEVEDELRRLGLWEES